ncbi:AcrR family transcriptional regulator [Hamadaea flava]|uniref:TetR/AcrR family transcriptional regulator C-terminal domain-containing protein n=1 Tax=Hamadaea flava TaxID=1742688 RepID=A0ABV8LNQ4_9ACTN|nr:TetR/AcrR family transcriptional regulator C-terminal domain-containing protein [Hamadaea flava]MCP2322769.1 AcrR family transcriptional regulator [Hamadaea flava]
MQTPVTSVWTREKRPAKSSNLDRAQIVRETLALLDEEGLDALSMRRLAARLGSGATSVYWHVANKDELLELVLDEVYGEFTVPVGDDLRWRDVVQRYAYSMWDTLIRHPWAVPLIGTRPAIGPNALRSMSRVTSTLTGAGFVRSNIDFAWAAVFSYVLGTVTSEVAYRAMVAKSGGDPQALQLKMRPLLVEAAADHPELIDRYDSYEDEDPAVARALSFDFGLISLLDGLTLRLERQER